jgi:hypothetical protein
MENICSFDSCVNKNYARNLCSGHYSQWKRSIPLKPIKIKYNQSNDPCSFSGCVNKIQAKQLCGAHWRQQRLGRELKPLTNQVSVLDRMLPQVDKTDDCWIWRGRVSGKRGYPQVSLSGNQRMVHRIMYEELVRPLDTTETLDHLCRNRTCVNPEHLEPVPLRENVQRMHVYKALIDENKKLLDFIDQLGYDIKTLKPKE